MRSIIGTIILFVVSAVFHASTLNGTLILLTSQHCDQLNANWRIATNHESATIKNRKRNDPRANVNQSAAAAVRSAGGHGFDAHLRGPSFVMEPPSRVEFSNSSGAWLDCTATGSPPPNIDWSTADGHPVNDVPGVRRVLRNGTLVLLPFPAAAFRQDVHSAAYRCVASNSVGRVLSRDVQVRAVVAQAYKVDVEVIGGASRGCTAVLRCVVPSFVKDLVRVVSWLQEPSFYIYPSFQGAGDGNKSPRDIPRAQMQQHRANRRAKGTRQEELYGHTFVWWKQRGNNQGERAPALEVEQDRRRDGRVSGGDFHVGKEVNDGIFLRKPKTRELQEFRWKAVFVPPYLMRCAIASAVFYTNSSIGHRDGKVVMGVVVDYELQG
ncbi:Down syndrome cell adhesion molecule-like protein Dscam2 [Melipona quadrifasciata]|uniref:Down syndrome cell adhesion molecule-like protein Dscam2 n=1 Tax=Melipona quadrifasciata TaxID=166423 RepID=A0A0M9A3X3_9HYME|nr:Down syndrome cell adhesion molecule-like protein Dscam2 [Melipona quadrifasciata]